MPSPFPGMDPYLEGYLWPDVHRALAGEIRKRLTPRLRPNYVARLDIYAITDPTPEAEIGIIYPDVEIVRAREPVVVSSSGLGMLTESRSAVAVLEEEEEDELVAPLTVWLPGPLEVRLVTVEIRDVAHNQLVTCIELLSPINKREPGLSAYRQKRQRLYQAGVHLVEIDLLRRGTRPLEHPDIPATLYRVSVVRSQAGVAEVWPLGVRDRLPKIPIPLRAPDRAVALDLAAALATIYDEAAYDLSIDYRQAPPPPVLDAADEAWMRQTVVPQ